MSIWIHNLSPGQTVTYGLPLLVGEVDDMDVTHVVVENTSASGSVKSTWPVCEGRFKVLVELQRGVNVLRLSCGPSALSFELRWCPRPSARFVRPVYVVCEDEAAPLFDGPPDVDRGVASARLRIGLGSRLLQTATAELMARHRFTHKTFVLESDVRPAAPPCHVFRSRLTRHQTLAMSSTQLWRAIGQQLMDCDQFAEKERCKWFCFMSFTRYRLPADAPTPRSHADVLAHTTGHAALGGGGLALFGTGNLHCWAETIGDVHRCFTDKRKMDRTKFMDDSAYRGFYWANYATSLGASLHELGHTFDLAHTRSGIMGRGFDDLHKLFTVERLRSRSSSASTDGYSPVSPEPANCLQQQAKLPAGVPSSTASSRDPPAPRRHVEQNFHRLTASLSLTYTVRRRDGTMQRTTDDDGGGDGTAQCIGSTLKPVAVCSTPDPCQPVADASPGCQPAGDASPGCQPGRDALMFGAACWDRCSAVLLNYHRWFNEVPEHKCSSVNITAEENGCGVVVRADCGVRHVELRLDSDVCRHWQFVEPSPPPQRFTLGPHSLWPGAGRPNAGSSGTWAA